MSPLRVVPYRDLRRVAERVGFVWKRCTGSHNTFVNTEGQIVVIPDHGSQVMVRSLLRKIIRDMGLSRDEYPRLLDT